MDKDENRAPPQHLLMKFQNEKGHIQGLKNLHPLPPSQGATNRQRRAKQEEHKKRQELQEPGDRSITEQKHMKPQNDGRARKTAEPPKQRRAGQKALAERSLRRN